MSGQTKFSIEEPVDPLLGQTVSDYEIMELIGAGGWSRVYKARHKKDDDIYAIKVLHSHLLFDKESLIRFEREANSGVSLSHANICRVFDYDRLATGQPYIVMEYLKGESLASILKRRGKLAEAAAVPTFAACLDGLQAAHDKGIVHRDVKPANIFILDAPDSSVKLLDFGMAKIIVGTQPDLTLTGTAFGTVQYMSPEQVLGQAIDGRSDLYSLGCVMYEALTGKKVFEGATAFGVMDQHVRAAAKVFRDVDPNTRISPAVEQLVMKALSKEATDRFQSAGEMRASLVKCAGDDVAQVGSAASIGGALQGLPETADGDNATAGKRQIDGGGIIGTRLQPHFSWILLVAVLALAIVSVFIATGPLK